MQNDTDLATDLVVKGFLKDFGKHDQVCPNDWLARVQHWDLTTVGLQCVTVPGAHYCHTGIKSSSFNTGPMSLATVGLCLPELCSSNDLEAVWTTIFKALNASSEFDILSTSCGNQQVAWDGPGAVTMTVALDNGSTVAQLLCVAGGVLFACRHGALCHSCFYARAEQI